ncbi:MAG: hypothetical protein IT349_16430 [Candidatus Eisenbacteria bacterium]|nr:hypothetical protein [Candidatus Eisenbacteria bacterium]MCC7143687.1 hypothetical protein [Candidatus Eisenbacteria bacterium]
MQRSVRDWFPGLTPVGCLMLVAALLLGGGLTGCGDDNPADDGEPACEHLDADGLLLRESDEVIVTQWQGATSGEVHAHHEETSEPIRVRFLDADSLETVPAAACVDHALRFEVADPTIAEISAVDGDRWAFTVRGLADGKTTFRIRVWHGDHADFTSLPIDLHVVDEGEIEAEGLVLAQKCTWLATWNYDLAHPEVATGRLLAPVGGVNDSIDVRFVSPDRLLFAPEGEPYTLGWEITDPSLVEVEVDPLDPWRVLIRGKVAGTTTVRWKILHEGHSDYTSGPIPLTVHVPNAGDAGSADFVLKLNGVWVATGRDGVLFSETCGSRPPAVNLLTAAVGDTTDLFNFQRLTEDCRGEDYDDAEYSLLFEFENGCMGGTVNHPEHWGEITLFHLVGVTAGRTHLRITVLRNDAIAYVTPPIPVEIIG